jgi:di/tricarboxylate transporter
MSFDALLLLGLLGATLLVLIFELLPVEVAALCLLVALLATGLVPLDAGLAGFSNKAVLTVGALFVLSHALTRTGVLEVLAERLGRRFGARSWLGIAALLVLVAVASGFLNNTAVVAMTIPLAVDLCRRFRLSPSRVLMPLSYAAIFGGTLTLVGTSTNLLVSALVESSGGEAIGMFEFTPLGAVFLACGLAYVLLVAPRGLPERARPDALTAEFGLETYLTELSLPATSKLVGQSAREAALSERYDVTALAVVRGEERITENLRGLVLRAGDLLVARGAMADILRLRQEQGVELLSDVKLRDEELATGEQVIVEALVSPTSSLIGRTLRDVDFRRTYGAFVLAVRREAEMLRERLALTPLRFADTLLLVCAREQVAELRRRNDLIVISEAAVRLERRRLWWLPVALVPGVIGLAALGIVDLLVGVMAAVALLLVLRVVRPEESYRAVEWQVVLFIAAFIPVGEAMFRTGLADQLARVVLLPAALLPAHLAPWVALSLLYLACSLATEVLTNNAAAIVLTPVALRLGEELGVDARPFVFAVCFAASASFMTPTGYQTNMMVYGPGNYRFTDFTRFGAPLNLLFWLLASLLIPWFWPFG